jgi:hypothetical protein
VPELRSYFERSRDEAMLERDAVAAGFQIARELEHSLGRRARCKLVVVLLILGIVPNARFRTPRAAVEVLQGDDVRIVDPGPRVRVAVFDSKDD